MPAGAVHGAAQAPTDSVCDGEHGGQRGFRAARRRLLRRRRCGGRPGDGSGRRQRGRVGKQGAGARAQLGRQHAHALHGDARQRRGLVPQGAHRGAAAAATTAAAWSSGSAGKGTRTDAAPAAAGPGQALGDGCGQGWPRGWLAQVLMGHLVTGRLEVQLGGQGTSEPGAQVTHGVGTL